MDLLWAFSVKYFTFVASRIKTLISSIHFKDLSDSFPGFLWKSMQKHSSKKYIFDLVMGFEKVKGFLLKFLHMLAQAFTHTL